jgi:uncharacterized protein YqeY
MMADKDRTKKVKIDPLQGDQAAPKRTQMDIFRDIGRAAAQGLTLGFSDEFEAGLRSIYGDKSYKEIAKEIRSEMEGFRESDPIVAYGAEILGSMLTGGVGASRAVGTTIGREAMKRAGITEAGESVVRAGGAGAAEGAVYGAGTGETISERIGGAAIGAPLGGVTAAAGQKIMPVLQEGAKSMLGRGYPLTMGQAYGGKIGSIEQKISTPFLQESIQEARRRPQQMFVRETIDEALKPLNIKVPQGFTGETAVDFAENAIGEAYDAVVPKAQFNAIEPNAKIEEILNKAKADKVFDASDLKAFRKKLNESYFRFMRNPDAGGEAFKTAESKLSGQIKSALQKGDVTDVRILREIQESIRDEFAEQNPDLPDLQAVNKAYRNMRPIVKLADQRASSAGEFTPTGLLKAETKGRARTSPEVIRAREARDILGQTVPDSGTAGRLAVGDVMTATTPRKMLGLTGNVLASTLYDYPKLGRGAAQVPARLMRSLAPTAATQAPSVAGQFMGLLGDTVFPEAQAGTVPVQEVYTTPSGLRYAITEQGATLLGE